MVPEKRIETAFGDQLATLGNRVGCQLLQQIPKNAIDSRVAVRTDAEHLDADLRRGVSLCDTVLELIAPLGAVEKQLMAIHDRTKLVRHLQLRELLSCLVHTEVGMSKPDVEQPIIAIFRLRIGFKNQELLHRLLA